MRTLGTAITLLFFFTQAQAAQQKRLIHFPEKAFFDDFVATQSNEISESIPQLHVVSIADGTEIPSHAVDLGLDKEITLERPQSVSAVLPNNYWGLRTIEVEAAWAYTQGEGVLVAVSDTGIDQNHPDLAANMWKNSGETGTDANGQDKTANGIDDDGNGYIDDVTGWDFVDNKPSRNDHHYHGTHVAGTIAAVNGLKISGVAPRARLMSVPFIGAGGSGSEENGAKTIVYAADNGARIINCSWGGSGKSPVVELAVEYAKQKGVLVVAAAGNDKTNIDRRPFMPASIDSSALLTVGATDTPTGHRAKFSNWGAISVDLAAPGANIRSTSKGGGYRSLSGTSMAAPHTSGVAALVWALHPEYSFEQVKENIMKGTVLKTTWAQRSVSSGILNARQAVALSQ